MTHPDRHGAAGFTLIEIIIAFAILALGLTLLLGTLSGATRQVRQAGDAGRAALHAQSLLAEFGELPRPGVREGEREDGRYRWRLEVEPWVDPAPPDGPDARGQFELFPLQPDGIRFRLGQDQFRLRASLPADTLHDVARLFPGRGKQAFSFVTGGLQDELCLFLGFDHLLNRAAHVSSRSAESYSSASNMFRTAPAEGAPVTRR